MYTSKTVKDQSLSWSSKTFYVWKQLLIKQLSLSFANEVWMTKSVPEEESETSSVWLRSSGLSVTLRWAALRHSWVVAERGGGWPAGWLDGWLAGSRGWVPVDFAPPSQTRNWKWKEETAWKTGEWVQKSRLWGKREPWTSACTQNWTHSSLVVLLKHFLV